METVKENPVFTKDKPMMLLAIAGGVLAFLNVVLVFARLRSHDFKVPVQYVVNDGSVLQTSNWFSLYSLALVSVLGAGAAIFLAHRIHKSSRMFATGILITYIAIALVTLLVTNALLKLVGRV